MAHAQRLVGIDFGTSTSVVRTKRYQDGEPIGDNYSSSGVTFGNGEGDTKAATLVRRNAGGGYTCGAEAEEAMPDSTLFREFKMHLESQDPGEQAQARELTKAYFRYLFERYDHQRSDLGEMDDEEQTLVSLPVKWREETRQFMARAAEEAGFKQVSIMDEPTAALYAALCRKMSEINQQGLLRAGEPGYMLLVDMGAGTTDLAVCRYTLDSRPGEVIRADRIKNDIVATWPEDRNAATFGGREVDRVLEDYVQAFLTSCGLPEPMAAQFVGGSGTSAAKRWKENSVSKLLNEGKRVETCAFIANVAMFLPQQKPFPAFGREEFERMLGDRLEQFRGLVTGCLQRASEAEPEILSKGLDLVILTGGHSAWYFTEELLNGTMPGLALSQMERVQREKSRVIRLTNPQETVALGLVYSHLPFQVGKQEEPAEPEPHREPEQEPQREQDGDSGGASADTARIPVLVHGIACTTVLVPANAGKYAAFAIAASDSTVQREIRGMYIDNVFWNPGRSIDLRCTRSFAPGTIRIEAQVNAETRTIIVVPSWYPDEGLYTVFAAAMADSTVQQAINGLEVRDIRYRPRQFINLICASKANQTPKKQVEKALLEPAKTPGPARSPAEIAMEVRKRKAESVQASAEELLSIWAKDFIDHYNAPVMKVMRRRSFLPTFRSLAYVRPSDSIYLEHNGTLDHTGSMGFVICQDGIHACNGILWHNIVLWNRLLDGTLIELKNGEIKIDFHSGKPEHVTPRLYSFDKLYNYRHELFQFFCELQAHLRDCLAEYRRHN